MEAWLQAVAQPSPVMRLLLMLLPVTITLAGLLGWAERERGNRRLIAWAGLLTIWLWLPMTFDQTELRQMGAMASMLGWLGLVGFWGHHVWTNRPTPVWAHGVVITHLVAIVVGGGVAMVRALAVA